MCVITFLCSWVCEHVWGCMYELCVWGKCMSTFVWVFTWVIWYGYMNICKQVYARTVGMSVNLYEDVYASGCVYVCVFQVMCYRRLPQGKREFSGLSHSWPRHKHSEKIFLNKYVCICHGNFLLHSGQQGFLELQSGRGSSETQNIGVWKVLKPISPKT